MEKTLLTADQILFLELFKKDGILASVFYLSGGTALAEFYLKHRYSDDLDFFTDQIFPYIAVEAFMRNVKSALSARDVEYKKLYDRHIFYVQFPGKEDLKVEFTLYPFARIEKSQNINGVMVDSLKDIAVNKLMAMIDRVEPKDFFDLYWIVKNHFSFDELRLGLLKKFELRIDDFTLGSELAKVKNLMLPIKKIKEVSDEEIRAFFARQSEALRKRVLDN